MIPAPSSPKTTHTTPRRKALIFCLTACALCSPVLGQFSVDWFTIDCGSGTSSGGTYSVSGTIGQPDAGGPMTNGPYSVIGGFWVLPQAVQTPGAPTLTIALAAPGYATISWTTNKSDFVLQETSLWPTNWVNAPSGATNPVTIPATLPKKFYRLFKL